MKKANIEIRNAISESGFTQWQVAEAIEINATTLTVWLRTPLNESRLNRVQLALRKMKKGAEVNV